jgi:peroxiredoxin
MSRKRSNAQARARTAAAVNGNTTRPGAAQAGSRPVSSLSPQARAQLAARAAAPRPAARPRREPPPPPPPKSAWRRALDSLPLPRSPGQGVFTATFVILAAIIVFAVIQAARGNGSYSASQGQITNGTPLAVGKHAPDFTLPSAHDGMVSLHHYLAGGSIGGANGKVVLLELYAPWCPHCQAETRVLTAIQAAYAGRGVQVLSVSASPYGRNYETSRGQDTTPISMSDVTWFADSFSLNYPALLDTSLRTGNAYGLYGYPTMFVIDRHGIITWNNGQGGETPYADLQAQLDKALAG